MIKFQNETSKVRFHSLLLITQYVLIQVAMWAEKRGLDIEITETVSTKEEDKKLSRVSTSHLQGRSVDWSVKNWELKDIIDCEVHFDEKFKEYAAISSKTKKPKLIVPHNNGNGFHIHMQVNRRFYEQ